MSFEIDSKTFAEDALRLFQNEEVIQIHLNERDSPERLVAAFQALGCEATLNEPRALLSVRRRTKKSG